jgi:succinate-semialdehyde dehydrogenase/glutarate-semialdehyde dehydrogenase
VPLTRHRIEVVNPATGEPPAAFEEFIAEQLERAVARAHAARRRRRDVAPAERARACSRLAADLRARRDGLARLTTLEMGKPILESRAEIDRCAGCCELYAERTEGFLADREIETDAERSYVRYEPLGFGRELSVDGMRELLDTRTFAVGHR